MQQHDKTWSIDNVTYCKLQQHYKTLSIDNVTYSEVQRHDKTWSIDNVTNSEVQQHDQTWSIANVTYSEVKQHDKTLSIDNVTYSEVQQHDKDEVLLIRRCILIIRSILITRKSLVVHEFPARVCCSCVLWLNVPSCVVGCGSIWFLHVSLYVYCIKPSAIFWYRRYDGIWRTKCVHQVLCDIE